MSLRGVSRRAQKGFYAITLAAILGGVSITVLSFSAFTAKKALFETDARKKSDIDLAIADLQIWYERQADVIAQSTATPTEEQLIAVLSRPYPGLRVAMSTSMAPDACASGSASIECIPWRQIAAWYPASVPPSPVSIVKGIPVSEFAEDAVWRVYSSQRWYVGRYIDAEKKMTTVGRALMSWFFAQQSLDSDRIHGTNFWRASGCAAPLGSLPCVDSYTGIDATQVLSVLGLQAADITPAVGSVVEFSNLQDSSSTEPFSVSLRVVTPWGAQLKKRVVQP